MADDKEGNTDELKRQQTKTTEEEGDENEEESRNMRGKEPYQEEYEAHMRTHFPFRKWCPHCVKGKRIDDPRRTEKNYSWDCTKLCGKDGRVDHTQLKR